jgi:hypothetical protein
VPWLQLLQAEAGWLMSFAGNAGAWKFTPGLSKKKGGSGGARTLAFYDGNLDNQSKSGTSGNKLHI